MPVMAIRPDAGENIFSELIHKVGAALDAPIEDAPDEFTLKRWHAQSDRIPNDGLRWLLQAQLSLLRGDRKAAQEYLDGAFRYAATHHDINSDIIVANAIVLARRMLDFERLERMTEHVMRLPSFSPELIESVAHTMLLSGDIQRSQALMDKLRRTTGNESMNIEKGIAQLLTLQLEPDGLLGDYRLMKQAIFERMRQMELTVVGDEFTLSSSPEGNFLINRITTREPVEEDPSVAVVFETDIVERISPRLADRIVFTVAQHHAKHDNAESD